MTFTMSELQKGPAKITIMEEDTEDGDAGMTIKEIEEIKKKDKQRQQRNDDIALVVCMLILLAVTGGIVLFKVSVLDAELDLDVSTFRAKSRQVSSNMKYNGMGYLPCNGYVPCQPEYLSEEHKDERMEGAMPCHGYQGKGDGPSGCW